MIDTDLGAAWTLVTGPAQEPISLADAKRQARITDDQSNDLLLSYIKAAREAAEKHMSRGLFTQIWKLTLHEFADVIPLPMAAPVQVVTIASVDYPKVEYYDSNGVLQALASTYWDVDTIARPARIVLKADQSWPSVHSSRMSGRVVITYVVGWANVADIPEDIKQGIRMYVTYLDMDRDGMALESDRARLAAEACWSDRVYWIPPSW